MKVKKQYKKSKPLTKEQSEYRAKILGKKYKPRAQVLTPLITKKYTRHDYMNNCMFWINEFAAGRTDKKDFVKSVTYLRDYCNEIIKENTPITPETVPPLRNPFEWL